MFQPKVSIIIPCRNEQNYIQRNIDSILAQDYLGDWEVLVVDGMSTDNTREIVGSYQSEKVKLIDNPARFTPNALNIGVDACEGEVFIILGGHAFISPDFVRKNIETLSKYPEIACAGGQIKNIFENKTGAYISKAMSSSFGVGNATFRTGGEAGFVDTVAFGAYYKKVHYEIGGFDEDLVRNQDDEYNFKIHQAGYKIYFNPEIISHYYVRGDLSKLYRQYYQYGYWKVYVNKKHKTITTLRQMIPLLFVLGLFCGALLSLLLPGFLWIYGVGLLTYGFLAFYSASQVAEETNEIGKIVPVFPILHFSYGLGYLVGIIEFLLLGKQPSRKSMSSTRG